MRQVGRDDGRLQELREAEVEHLDVPSAVSLSWPASDRDGRCRARAPLERFENLPRDLQRFFDRHGPRAVDRRAYRLDELEDQEARAVRFGEIVDGGDAGVIERRHGLRLAMKARDAIGIARVGLGQAL